jgi:hypothetical protein
LYAGRLLAGRTRVRLPRDGGRPRPHFIIEPDADARHLAAELSAQTFARGRKRGLPTADEAVGLLRARRLWGDADEAALDKGRTDADTLRAAIFERRDRPAEREPVRQNLRACEARVAALLARRSAFYHQTADGLAAAARLRVLVAAGLTAASGRRVWKTPERALADRSALLDAAVVAYLAARPSAAQLRELARTDPWRGVWAAREDAGGLFGRPAASLSEDQLALVQWTRLHEAAREAEEGPGEYADDDDVVDGWLALRAKDAAAGGRAKGLDALTRNPKTRNAPHVFVFADAYAEATEGASADGVSPEAFDRATAAILAMNSPQAMAAMNRRFGLIDQFGQVDETRMPDSLQRR